MLIPHSAGKPGSTKRQKILEHPEDSPPGITTDRQTDRKVLLELSRHLEPLPENN